MSAAGVRNQGGCGACWAFVTAETVEAAWNIAGQRVGQLSVQQQVDCSTSYGNSGCWGGWMGYSYTYAVASGGLCAESSYPYTATTGACKTTCTRIAKVKSSMSVTANNDAAMEAAVRLRPVAVAVQATEPGFQFYASGVFTGSCGSSVDHAVTVYGYDTDAASGLRYWKVKNQWGTGWGEGGYMRMVRDATLNGGTGQCGMYQWAMYPVVA
jgi:KDEL-tailed cysteine endopeptidase